MRFCLNAWTHAASQRLLDNFNHIFNIRTVKISPQSGPMLDPSWPKPIGNSICMFLKDTVMKFLHLFGGTGMENYLNYWSFWFCFTYNT